MDDLWHRLQTYDIGPAAAPLSFAARLARENRWSEDYAARVIIEYKRFCYLAMTAGRDVTPSDQVDQAWHLHLTYTRDYWDRFCPKTLGGALHHGPTTGSGADKARYFEQYAQTLKTYEEAFGETPPADIWSPATLRFGEHTRAFRTFPANILLFRDKRAIVIVLTAIAAAFAVGLTLGASI